jgi:hypothetical protein
MIYRVAQSKSDDQRSYFFQIEMAKITFVHHGPVSSIPSDASPGLLFLKAYLPALDSLSPATQPIAPFLTPLAVFMTNGGSPVPAATIASLMNIRAGQLQAFRHDVVCAWDVADEGDGESRSSGGEAGKRTVMFESVSVTAFNANLDPEGKEVLVPEFGIIELEPMQGGILGLGAARLRTYMDAQPVMKHHTELRKRVA